MRSDLDELMEEKHLDAIIVTGNADHNPPMYYLTGGGHISAATLIKKCHGEVVLFCNAMEHDEAAKTGFKVIPYSAYNYKELLEEAQGDASLTSAVLYKRMLTDLEVRGRVGIYGMTDLGSAFLNFTNLQKLMSELELVGESSADSLFMKAMETKDSLEIDHIRKMGAVTTEVVRRTAEYLTSREVRADEVLLKEDGTPLTIRDVKAKISLWIAELGAEDPEGTIFAIGRDAGVPHSVGNPEDLMRLGQTIVFDIYPCEAGGGYFYDFTRTWSLGYATPEAQKLYDEVKLVYDRLQAEFDLNASFKDYQHLTCELFEKNGHQTPLNTPAPEAGYVHSIGHGVGLNIHERPWSNLTSNEDNILKPGVVFTSEPGLYYPEKGLGVRIEDTCWVRPDGKIERLAEYPYDFVLKMEKWQGK
ncbi:MAG TPA: Xaa-Pro peptidase family protein [Anaerolineales bacterium]|nr:Xaa-Pro peptidase family protein [Anaerolineales bacterium]